MKKLKATKLASAGVLSIGLVMGMAGFAGATTGSIDTTGPRSNNRVRHESRVDLNSTNSNNLDLTNRATQQATSGEARVRFNTTGGAAETGSVTNDNVVDALIEVDNSGSAAGLGNLVDPQGSDMGSIENTGPDSDNVVRFDNRTNVSLENTNDISVSNTIDQTAESGDARVTDNTTGGDAVSGDVSNTSSSIFTVSISN